MLWLWTSVVSKFSHCYTSGAPPYFKSRIHPCGIRAVLADTNSMFSSEVDAIFL